MNVPLSKKEKIKILNTEDLYGIMQQVLLREDKIDQDREHFWVIGLANNNRILFIELVSMGSVNKTIVEPMEVFSLALQKRAVHLILCHNHPSGDLTPSAEDKDLTDRLIQVGLIVNLPVLDHQIISTKGYLSFEYTGLMAQLRNSIKYVPSFEMAKRFRTEAAAIMDKREVEFQALIKNMEGQLQQKQEKLRASALTMKKAGMALAVIAEVTGLSLEEVEGL